MEHEFMSTVPDSVQVVNDCGTVVDIFNDEMIFSLTVDELLNVLQNDSEFYKNPTRQQLANSIMGYLKKQVESMTDELSWYIVKVLPEFVKDDLK